MLKYKSPIWLCAGTARSFHEDHVTGNTFNETYSWPKVPEELRVQGDMVKGFCQAHEKTLALKDPRQKNWIMKGSFREIPPTAMVHGRLIRHSYDVDAYFAQLTYDYNPSFIDSLLPYQELRIKSADQWIVGFVFTSPEEIREFSYPFLVIAGKKRDAGKTSLWELAKQGRLC